LNRQRYHLITYNQAILCSLLLKPYYYIAIRVLSKQIGSKPQAAPPDMSDFGDGDRWPFGGGQVLNPSPSPSLLPVAPKAASPAAPDWPRFLTALAGDGLAPFLSTLNAWPMESNHEVLG
jgi:hypothetical protein